MSDYAQFASNNEDAFSYLTSKFGSTEEDAIEATLSDTVSAAGAAYLKYNLSYFYPLVGERLVANTVSEGGGLLGPGLTTTLIELNAPANQTSAAVGELADAMEGTQFLAIGIGFAAYKIYNAAPGDRLDEAFKQGCLLSSSYIAAAFLTAMLSPALGAVGAAVIATAAVGAGVYYVDTHWNYIVSDVGTSIVNGLTAIQAADHAITQFGGDFITNLENLSIQDIIDQGQNSLNSLISVVPATLEHVTDAIKTDIAGLFHAATSTASPLVIDLGHNGLNLSSLSGSSAYFDLTGNHFATNTGWVDTTATNVDGILALDKNHDGLIKDGSELFGTVNAADGFADLASYDLNGDGKITAEDAVWSDLRVWVDANGDGISQADELKTMSDVNIVSISLSDSVSTDVIAGNTVPLESTVTFGDTTTAMIGDVYFSTDTINSQYVGNYTADVDALFLPDSRGYGTLADLHAAMSIDNNGGDPDSLISLVTSLSSLDENDLFTGTAALNLVTDIMYRWAGVDGAGINDRGLNIDARQLEFLEKLMGEAFIQGGAAGQANPGPFAGQDLQEAFHDALNTMFARFTAQAAGHDLFLGDASYNPATDSFSGITGLNTTTLSSLESTAAGLANTAARETFWDNVVRTVEFTVGTANLSPGDLTALQNAIHTSDSSLTLSGNILPDLDFTPLSYNSINGTSGVDTLTGTSGADDIHGLAGNDTITGGAGNDKLDGGDGADTITGGAGQDYMLGGAGSDTYIYTAGDGDDGIREGDETGATDQISFAAGITLANLTITRISDTGMLIAINNGVAPAGSITIENQFNYTSGNGNVEQLHFSDNSTYNLENVGYTLHGSAGNDNLYGVRAGFGGTGADTIYGGDGNDVIHGYAPSETDSQANTLYGENGNDTIFGGIGVDTIYGGAGNDNITGDSGNDLLHGDTGNDTISGGTGNDTFYYVSGKDVYSDSSGTDSIVLDPSYTQAGTHYYRIGNDMEIYFDANNNITISNFFSSSSNHIETLDFATGTDTDLTTVGTINQGTSGNDTLAGTTGDDIIYGFDGNDTLNGASGSNGNDTLYGGNGNDALNGGAGADYLDGGAGDDNMNGGADNDIYVYVSGHDTVTDGSSSTADEIRLAQGWTLADLTFSRNTTDGTGNAIIGFVGDGGVDTIKITSQLSTASAFVETLRFADNSTLSLSGVSYTTYGDSGNNSLGGVTIGGGADDIMYGYAGTDTLSGGSGNDTLYGGDGNDTLNGGDGNDILYGDNGNDILDGGNGNDIIYGGAGSDTVSGGAGDDTFVYSGGLAVWQVDSGGGTDTLKIVSGATINDLVFTNFSTDDTKITINSGVDEITLNNERNANTAYHVEYVSFSDGFVTTLDNYGSWITGTTSGETINGTSSADTIVAKAGNDTVNAGAGNDAVHGGDGNDTLHGEGGDDLLHGGAGDDILDGGDGLDTLYGGAGADIFQFKAASAFNNVDVVKDFNVSEGDKLDISDILSGHFTPGTDDITHFVEIVTSGGNSEVYVDTSGTSNFSAGHHIATIFGVTGLTDEAADVTAGLLKAA